MKFSQRLAYYLLGLMIGSFAVFYFIDQKDTSFCYLPNCRVLKDLRNKPIVFSPETDELLKSKTITLDEVKNCLTHGDIDFATSNVPDSGGKLYIINGKDKNMKDVTIEMVNYDNRVLFKSFTNK